MYNQESAAAARERPGNDVEGEEDVAAPSFR